MSNKTAAGLVLGLSFALAAGIGILVRADKAAYDSLAGLDSGTKNTVYEAALPDWTKPDSRRCDALRTDLRPACKNAIDIYHQKLVF
jgi:hypothetical protein